MFRLILKTFFLFVLFFSLSLQSSESPELLINDQILQRMKTQDMSKSLKISQNYGQFPLYFVPNEGQVDGRALFYAKTSKYTLWLTKEGLVFDGIRRRNENDGKPHFTHPRQEKKPKDSICERDVSRMFFLNANKDPEVIPIELTMHKVNYFIGSDKSNWRTNIHTARAVLYKEIYGNIDIKVYGNEKQIEYDFIVKPGGEVSDIFFEYKDIESTNIDREGNLVIETKFGELRHAKPVCYQVIEGKRIEVGAEFGQIEMNTYSFEVKEYNGNYELIIDPVVLAYSTYLGGSDSDYGYGIAVDSVGAAYITGYTYSSDFPTENPMQGSFVGAYDVFISKINPAGSTLIYSTYLGGSDYDWCDGIAVDSEGTAYITGCTRSADFPTKNPIQGDLSGYADVFISKINSAGSALIYSTYLGGTWGEGGDGIAVDSEGAVYVTGSTSSYDFPTVNPIQEWPEDGFDNIFVSKINPAGSALVYSTYLGYEWDDSGEAIAVDSEGAAYVTGYSVKGDYPWGHPSSAFVIKINPSGSVLDYLYEWGGGYRSRQAGWGIAVDAEGAAYVTDTSYYLEEWPNEDDIDAYVTKINVDGDNIIYTISLAGSGNDFGAAIAIDLKGAAYVTGRTDSDDFPINNPIQDYNAGGDDVFITKINPDGTFLVHSTYLGGSGGEGGYDIALDLKGSVYVTGVTASLDFPTKNPIQASCAGEFDSFITKICKSPVPDIKANGSDGPITISRSDTLIVTVDFDAGSLSGIEADGWLVAQTPLGWYYYDRTAGWLPGKEVTLQIPLRNFPSIEVLNMSGLPAGNYTFYFGVDLIKNGLINIGQAFYDSAEVTINP